MNLHNIKSPAQQRGAVLLISMLILIVLTLIGITGLSNTSLEERMSHNFQQSTVAYQGAESAIENVMTAGNPETDENPNYDADTDPMVDAINAGKDDTSTVVTYNIGADHVDTATQVTYLADAACPGASFGTIVCYVLEARATASIDATNTETTHIQGFRRPGPDSGSSGVN